MSDDAERQRALLAYEAALRTLDQQRDNLEQIRIRTGVLLAAASLSASFLGSKAFDRHANAIVTCFALAALVLTLLFGILVLTLDENLAFSLSGPTLHTYLRSVGDRADQHRRLAHLLDAVWERNKPSMERLDFRFQIAAAALATQIVLWTLAISASFG